MTTLTGPAPTALAPPRPTQDAGNAIALPGLSQSDRIQDAARDFAGILYSELLQPMLQTVDLSDCGFGGGAAERTLQPLWLAEIARHMAASDGEAGLGVTALVAREMARMTARRGR